MKFIPINRSHDVISGKEDLETIYTIPDFPVFMGVTTSSQSEDIKFPMTFQISKSTGIVQINPLVPLDLVYQKSHNSGIIGKTWQEHHKKLSEFIMKFNPTDVLEIGGFTGILAAHCVTKSRNLHWAIVDPHASLGTKHATVYKQFFDRNFNLENKVEMIVHSHLLEHIIDIKKQCLRKRGCFYTCFILPFAYQFYILQKQIPTEEELQETIQNMAAFERDPEGYHEKDKVLVPTLNLDKLSPIVKDTFVSENCSLCQTEIGFNSFYKIPPCNHIFHADTEHCLGDSNIITWLSNHKQCPNCKTIVSISDKQSN